VHEGHFLIVKALVEGGCDIEAVEDQGYTALMWAAEEGRVDTISFLIERGASLNVQNNQGGTALMWSVYELKTEAAKLLLKAGADPNLQNVQCSFSNRKLHSRMLHLTVNSAQTLEGAFDKSPHEL
jgi:ankyrin repeat protein